MKQYFLFLTIFLGSWDSHLRPSFAIDNSKQKIEESRQRRLKLEKENEKTRKSIERLKESLKQDELEKFIAQQVQGYQDDIVLDTEKAALEQFIKNEINRDCKVTEIIQEFLELQDLLNLYEKSFDQATIQKQQALIRLIVQATLQETAIKDDKKSNVMLIKEIKILQKILPLLDLDQRIIIQKRIYRLQQILIAGIAYLKPESQETYYGVLGMYE